MNIQEVAIKKARAIVVDALGQGASINNDAQVLTLNANMMSFGFIMSEDLYQQLCQLKGKQLVEIATDIIPVVKTLKGAHVKHKPMYPNFPRQVMQASDVELYLNALFHYYSYGEWMPEYEAKPRKFAFEEVKFQEIDVIDHVAFLKIFTTLLQSHDSISDEDKGIIKWFLAQKDADQLVLPDEIPFHENMCLIAAHYLQNEKDITPLVNNATDILRIATHVSEGDVSLAENTRFKSLPRSLRRVLTKQLERVINEEDIGRHRNKWVRLFHNLHIGDYSDKVYDIAKKARNNGHLKSFYSDLEAALSERDIKTALRMLSSRPGEFGRRLDHLLRVAEEADLELSTNPEKCSDKKAAEEVGQYQHDVIKVFLSIVDKIPTRNLTQLYGHLNSRAVDSMDKIIFPKGSFQNAVVVDKYLYAFAAELLLPLKEGIQASLKKRFSKLDELGKVWLDPALTECPLPTQQRSASTGLFNMARGTRMPILDNKDTLRFFVYWVGKDIDLSATFHDESGKIIEHVSYTNLRSAKYQAYHSGDITSAPHGATEFIDINITESALRARYLAMNVLVYNGPAFDEHKECFVGWMTRNKPKSNELFEPATVQQKIDLNQNCRNIVPVVFDLHERKAIWVDLPASRSGFYANNNVENNRASIQQKLYAIVNSSNKLSLYELFEMHAKSRGEVVLNRDEADITFSLDGDVTPFDVNVINAEYLQ